MENNISVEQVVIALSSTTSDGNNYFHEACTSGIPSLVERFIPFLEETPVNLLNEKNSSGLKCVHLAVLHNHDHSAVSLINLLQKHGADINAKEDLLGETILHMAVRKSDQTLVKWLCSQKQIDLNAINYCGRTPLNLARKMDAEEIVEVLLESGAGSDINCDSEPDITYRGIGTGDDITGDSDSDTDSHVLTSHNQ